MMHKEHSDISSAKKPIPLAMADEGKPFKIVLLRGGKSIDKRLGHLGLNLNSILEIVNRQGNSLVIGKDHTRFAMASAMAQKIMVVPA